METIDYVYILLALNKALVVAIFTILLIFDNKRINNLYKDLHSITEKNAIEYQKII